MKATNHTNKLDVQGVMVGLGGDELLEHWTEHTRHHKLAHGVDRGLRRVTMMENSIEGVVADSPLHLKEHRRHNHLDRVADDVDEPVSSLNPLRNVGEGIGRM